MRGQQLLPIGLLTLLLCPPLMATELEHDQPDEFVADAINECEYWASISDVSNDDRIEYVENCVTEELASYEGYPLANDLPESFNAPTIWE